MQSIQHQENTSSVFHTITRSSQDVGLRGEMSTCSLDQRLYQYYFEIMGEMSTWSLPLIYMFHILCQSFRHNHLGNGISMGNMSTQSSILPCSMPGLSGLYRARVSMCSGTNSLPTWSSKFDNWTILNFHSCESLNGKKNAHPWYLMPVMEDSQTQLFLLNCRRRKIKTLLRILKNIQN